MTGVVIISSTPIQYQGGSDTIGPLQISAPNPILQVNSVTFGGATSALEVVGPFGATSVLIVPPPNNLVELSLKGASGDTGLPMSANQPSLFTFFNNAVNFQNFIYMGAMAAVTGTVTCTWF